MAAVVSTRIARLYALSPRTATAAMPGLTVDFADVTGTTKPSDNADVALPTANTALSTANAAASDATTALNTLSDIASDNLLTPVEKPPVIADYAVITGEQAGIDGQATAYSITTEKTNYDNAVSALTTYLGTLTTPVAWNNISGNTTIVGTTFRTNFADVYTKRQALLNAIYAKAKTIADAAAGTATWGGVTGAGKPADNADVTASHTAAGITGQGDLATLDTVGTSQVDAGAVTNSTLGTAGSVATAGAFTGSVGAPTFDYPLFTGAMAQLTSAQTAFGLMFQWHTYYSTGASARLIRAMMNSIQYRPANSANLGNMTVTVQTFSGFQCLRFALGSALPAAVTGAGANACLTIPGQPYMYVRGVDGPNGYIYASSDPNPSTNVGYLVGAGTYPATTPVKFWGSSTGNNMVVGVFRSINIPANSTLPLLDTDFGNISYGGDDVAFSIGVQHWPTSANAESCTDTCLLVSEMKR